MPHDRRTEVSALRMDNAKTLIETANVLIAAGDYKSAANRAYYAVFSAMRACLALLGLDHKKHSGVMSDFRLHFIKTEKLRIELSDIVSKLFYIRTQSDYNDFFTSSQRMKGQSSLIMRSYLWMKSRLCYAETTEDSLRNRCQVVKQRSDKGQECPNPVNNRCSRSRRMWRKRVPGAKISAWTTTLPWT